MAARPGWYLRRLARMSPLEVGWRVETRLRQEAWAHRRFQLPDRAGAPQRTPPSVPPGAALTRIPPSARLALVAAADELLRGRAEVLGVLREDVDEPVWSLDPVSGRSYPNDCHAFRIDVRAPGDDRHVKQVWELSRHHHLTVLASAWYVSGDERYASMVARQLRSWWEANPIMSGVNWSSGIELGIRLISWAWIRRLLGTWPEAPALFEQNHVARAQIYWHQRFLEAFYSRASSANNHVVAEAAGWFVASCAFPWFAESAGWRVRARELLERELAHNTFPDGVDREQAFGYHGLVAELVLVAAAEGEAAGTQLGPDAWARLCRMLDVAASVLDCSGRPPRHGDGDDGRALVLDDPAADRWGSLLALGAAIFGRPAWWPPVSPDARSIHISALMDRSVRVGGRPPRRLSHFPSAGLTILRSSPEEEHELWCCCDGGPHGFLSIAAHAHADALSFELRHDGVELLADPGTYCYQGEPRWRRYFRSTLAHNTIELDGRDQSVPGGPFLWVRHARTRMLDVAPEGGGSMRWSAEHRGYDRLRARARHRRDIVLEPVAGSLSIVDRLRVTRPRSARMAFHLGPSVDAVLEDGVARLRWEGRSGDEVTATMLLPEELEWHAWRGATDPPLGWYSAEFGRKQPTTAFVGTGRLQPEEVVLRSELRVGQSAGRSGALVGLPSRGQSVRT